MRNHSDILLYENHLDQSIIYPEIGDATPTPEEMAYLSALLDGYRNGFKTKYRYNIDEIPLEEKYKKGSLAVTVANRTYRAQRIEGITGGRILFRGMPESVPDIKDLSLNPLLLNALIDPRLNRGGLILISGSPGNGKSTTIASAIIARLQAYGGLCLTLEDPPEMPLDGIYNRGVCIQQDVDAEQFADALKQTLRSYPSGINNMLLLGEVRDAETAEIAIRSANDGRLVFMTMHAGNNLQAIKVLLSRTEDSLGHSQARQLLGNSCRLFVHQQLKKDPRNPEKKILHAEMLQDTQAVASIISNPETNLDHINNEQAMQNNIVKLRQKIELRPIY
ncbi:ATPase, T2SS/T4P/T4SS family [Neptuniibacter sp. QD37_11]|uniref:ATPase, T2SS/T4P/T4SS family n=1 Tax=Neptuniibacter sp. QD37_11 TaxID=3398209 RepID=UPI0039F5ED2A